MLKRLRDFFCLSRDEWRGLCEFAITATLILSILTLLAIFLSWWWYWGGL